MVKADEVRKSQVLDDRSVRSMDVALPYPLFPVDNLGGIPWVIGII